MNTAKLEKKTMVVKSVNKYDDSHAYCCHHML